MNTVPGCGVPPTGAEDADVPTALAATTLHCTLTPLARPDTIKSDPLPLAACAPQVESTIYLADVEKVLADGTALETPALLRIPQSGEDDCKKGLAGLIEKVRALAPVTGKGQCVSLDGD